ncbi:MAG: hypothetical protein HYZ57_21600 [Acidobacteria bacterium]|nr:hypothetical protein [Acidobacteriota bacterium]
MSRISSTVSREKLVWWHVYLGVAFTTLATLVLELALTRIFSVIFYYHFAFLAISLALFGLGAGGVLSYWIARRKGNVYTRLGTLGALNSLAVVSSLVFVLSRTDQSYLTLAGIYFASAVPFVFAGSIVSLAIAETIERVHRVYFFDLLGAAAGCMVLVPFLNALGGPNTVLAAAVFFAVASAIWFNLGGQWAGRVVAVALALGCTGLLILNQKRPVIDVKFAKGQHLGREQFVKWNSFSRIALAPDPSGMMLIYIDADASTGIAKFDFANLSERDRRDLMLQGPGFAYQLRPGAKTLIIGPGGGWDVARALAAGSRDITGVEINPIIANTLMRQQFPHLSNRLYFRPEVRMIVEDGRSFIRRSHEQYEVIQATLVDTWASTAAGAFALSENNLYTTEAFTEYLKHLTGRGILSFTRWGFDPPRESLRLLALARVALAALGERDIARHVIVVREGSEKELAGWGARDTVVISRKPLTPEDVAGARATIAAAGLQAVYLPGSDLQNEFQRYLTSPDPRRFEEDYRYDIAPVTDNRPFFFYTVQPRDVLAFVANARESADYKVNRAVPMLFTVLGVSLLATVVTILLPPLLLGSRLPRDREVQRFLFYFVCIGAGYILIQVALIQRFVLFLGHPTYALTVIVFSMLVSSGLGSYFSHRIVAQSGARLRTVLMAVAALVIMLALLAPAVTRAGIALPMWLKIALTIVLIAPAGFAMGMPFPTGLARLERRHSASVRWAWSLNAASSVLGSALAIFLAIYLGLQATLLCGALLYIAAMLVSRSGAEPAA